MAILRWLLLLILVPSTLSAQMVSGGNIHKGGNQIFTTAQGSAVVAGAIPLSNAPIAGTCSSEYKGIYQLGLYFGCTNTPETNWNADLLAALPLITRRNASGTSCTTSGCYIVFLCKGMSVALAECAGLINAAGSLTQVRITNQAVSNNDADKWYDPANWATGVQPNACLTPYQQCTASVLKNPPANFGDEIATNFATGGLGLNFLQVQVGWTDTANGTQHQDSRGSVTTGCGTSGANYYNAPPLDGVHAINNPAFNGMCTANQPNDMDATNVELEIAGMERGVKARAPNFVLDFLTGRVTASGCTIGCANPEPEDFEISLAIRDLHRAQACELGDNGCTAGTIDPNVGDLCPLTISCGGSSVANKAPFIALADVQPAASNDGIGHSAMFWGNMGIPQLTDSTNVWCNNTPSAPCLGENDFGSDNIHLNATGEAKAGGLLQRFLVHSPYSRTWFN